MSEAPAYWSQACDVVHRLHCWVRVVCSGSPPLESWWGQGLGIPVPGYLEGPGPGPEPIRDVEWVDISTKHVKGGIAGRPLELIDIEQELLSELKRTRLIWSPRETTWTVVRVFEDQPVRALSVFNPFRAKRASSRGTAIRR